MIDEEAEVTTYVTDGEWNVEKLRDSLPEDMVQHITDNIKPPLMEEGNDTACWTIENSGDFTVKSAWEFLRPKFNK